MVKFKLCMKLKEKLLWNLWVKNEKIKKRFSIGIESLKGAKLITLTALMTTLKSKRERILEIFGREGRI